VGKIANERLQWFIYYFHSNYFKMLLGTLIFSYLLGSIPTGYLLVKWTENRDIRKTGSGNIGATNVYRVKGLKYGVLVAFLDALKGFIPVIVSYKLFNSLHLATFAGVASIYGHCFPLYLGFQGGKGVATAFGVYVALFPYVALGLLFIFLATVFFTKYVSLASIIASIAGPIFLIPHTRSEEIAWLTISIAFLVIFQHRGNIKRLLTGNEKKFGGHEQ